MPVHRADANLIMLQTQLEDVETPQAEQKVGVCKKERPEHGGSKLFTSGRRRMQAAENSLAILEASTGGESSLSVPALLLRHAVSSFDGPAATS